MEIVLDRLSLHRGDKMVLRDVSWQVLPGERWLVVGASGAGKTQLLKILAGDVWPDESAHAARRHLYQGEWHDTLADVREEIAWLGPERQDRYERYGWDFPAVDVVGTGLHRTDIPLNPLTEDERDQCGSLLKRAGVGRLARRNFLALSYGERRLVLLARALAWRASLLLLDEVATGLDLRNRKRLFALLGSREARTMGWVSTAHRMEDAPGSANRLLWLCDGRVEFAGKLSKTVLRRALGAARSGQAVHAVSSVTGGVRGQHAGERAVKPLLELGNANVWVEGKRLLTQIDLTIRAGECWVVHGANGAGKSTLIRTLYGDHAVASDGFIKRAGRVAGVPLEYFRARTGLIAAHLQTDYPRETTVLETVVSGLHASIGLNFPVTGAEQRRARASLAAFGMESFADLPLAEMSYGQVRRVLFARAAVLRPRLLLLDEPFTGLDSALRAELFSALETWISQGITVVLATHYRSEWPHNASHELLLSRGRVTYTGTIRK